MSINVALLRHTPDPEIACATAARLCYSPADIETIQEKMTLEGAEKLIGKILSIGHTSILEHASFTFGVEGISRACSHQLVRHRVASYSQQSQRYVAFDEGDFPLVIPATISTKHRQKIYQEAMDACAAAYRELVADGVPAEDARYVLPNATETKIIISMNARELLHFFSIRCCNRAQWEIRDMSDQMLLLAKRAAPILFAKAGPGCLWGSCPEGSMCCGIPRIRAEFEVAI